MFGLMVVMALVTFICCLYQLFKSYILVTSVVFVALVCLVPTSTFARAWLHLWHEWGQTWMEGGVTRPHLSSHHKSTTVWWPHTSHTRAPHTSHHTCHFPTTGTTQAPYRPGQQTTACVVEHCSHLPGVARPPYVTGRIHHAPIRPLDAPLPHNFSQNSSPKSFPPRS